MSTHSVLDQFEGQLEQGLYARPLWPYEPCPGGTLAGFEQIGKGLEPDTEAAVLLKVFIKE